ncbi:MAG: DNA-binding protein [Thermoproteota archaeon]|nr:MAG: DNA-binding protein [Candidatus Korarchaeota archaeon]
MRGLETSLARVLFLRLEEGEEIISSIKRACSEAGVSGALVMGIGGVSSARVGFFDPEEGGYREVEVSDFHEVASLLGNVSVGEGGEAIPHVHVVLGYRPEMAGEKACLAGHLIEGRVRGTMELALLVLSDPLRRVVPGPGGLRLIEA